MQINKIAKELDEDDSNLVSTIQFAGITCESELNGYFISSFTDIRLPSLNLLKLHANKFGTFPIVAIPGLNLLPWDSHFIDLNVETGLSTLVSHVIKEVPEFDDPRLSHEELFNIVQFLTCIWTDIRVEMYRYAFAIYWRPLISFENPVYYQQGKVNSWDKNCNILRAELMEIINSAFRFVQFSYGDYKKHLGATVFGRKRARRTNSVTTFPLLNASNEDIYNYPGVACLDTEASRKTACNMLTIIRGLLARLCCMLLRIPADSIVVNTTTWNTLADDLKQLYHIIQKMEGYLNN